MGVAESGGHWLNASVSSFQMKNKPPKDNLGLGKTMLYATVAGVLLIGAVVAISKGKAAIKSAREKRQIEIRDQNMAEAQQALEPSKVSQETQDRISRYEIQKYQEQLREFQSNPVRKLELVDFNPDRGGFGAILMVSFTLKNNYDRRFSDIKVRFIEKGKSGTEINSRELTIYDSIEAGETKKFNDFNVGFVNSQTDSVSMDIVDADYYRAARP